MGHLLEHAQSHLRALAHSLIPYITAQYEHYQRQHPELAAAGGSLPKDLSLDELDSLSHAHFRALSDVITPTMKRAFRRRGMQVLRDMNAEASLHMVDRHAVDYAEWRGAELITDLTDATRNMVHDTVVNALEERWSAGRLASELRDSQAFSPARALNIARTELQMSFRAGGREAAAEAGARKKSWSAAPDSCPLCAENADQGWIDFNDEYVNGEDIHPNCSCTEDFAADTGL